MWERLQNLIQRFLNLSFGVRLAIAAFIGAITGSGYIGLLAEFGAYTYAISYGFRPPLEGIPFLKATVSATSFFLLIAGAAVFFVTFAIGRIALLVVELTFVVFRKAQAGEIDTLIAILRAVPLLWKLIYLIVGTPTYSAIVWPITWLVDWPIDPRFLIPICCFVILYVTVLPQQIRWLAIGMTVVFLVAPLFVFFNSVSYAKFLRYIGYGGGMLVTLTVSDESNTSQHIETNLLLRTSSAIITYEREANVIKEIPMRQIEAVIHPPIPPSGLPYALPAPASESTPGETGKTGKEQP